MSLPVTPPLHHRDNDIAPHLLPLTPSTRICLPNVRRLSPLTMAPCLQSPQNCCFCFGTCVDCTMAFKFASIVVISILVIVAWISLHQILQPVSKVFKVSQAFPIKSSVNCSDCPCCRAGFQDYKPVSVSGTSPEEFAGGEIDSKNAYVSGTSPKQFAGGEIDSKNASVPGTSPKEFAGGKIAVCILGEIPDDFQSVFQKHKAELVDKLQSAVFLSAYKRRWRGNRNWCDSHPAIDHLSKHLFRTHGCDDIQKSGGDDWIYLIQQIEKVIPLQGWTVHTRYSSQHACPPGTVDELEHFGQHERMRDCADLIRRDESITGTRYSWVMKVRPDYWTEGWPQLAELIPMLQFTKAYIHGFRELGCPHDQFVLFHRSHLEELSALLAQGYQECRPGSSFAGYGATFSECNFGVLLAQHFREGPSVLPWSGIEGCYGLTRGEHFCPPGRSCSFP